MGKLSGARPALTSAAARLAPPADCGSPVDARRGSARKRGYDARWDREAIAFKEANPICLGCSAVGRLGLTEVVDHIVPHKGDRALFRDPANRQPACRWHHDVVKQRLEAQWQAGAIDRDDLRLDSPAAQALTRSLSAG